MMKTRYTDSELATALKNTGWDIRELPPKDPEQDTPRPMEWFPAFWEVTYPCGHTHIDFSGTGDGEQCPACYLRCLELRKLMLMENEYEARLTFIDRSASSFGTRKQREAFEREVQCRFS